MDAELAGAAASDQSGAFCSNLNPSESLRVTSAETAAEAAHHVQLLDASQILYPPPLEAPLPPSDDLTPIPSPLPHAPPSPPRSPVSWRLLPPVPAATAAGPAASTSSVSSSSPPPPPVTSSSTSTATSASFSSHPTVTSVGSVAATAGGEDPAAPDFGPDSFSGESGALARSPPSESLAVSPIRSPQVRSPSSSSVFLSASNSPFCSPLAASSSSNPSFLTPPSASYVTASNTPFKVTPASSQRYNPGHAPSSHEHERSQFVPEITPVDDVVPFPAAAPPAPPAPASLKSPLKSSRPQKTTTTTTFRSSPRRALALGRSFHPSSSYSVRPRTCDIFISLYGSDPGLLRFSKWMRAELELQGVACFTADRSLYSEQRSHDIALRIMNSATFGIVIISRKLFRNPLSIQEIRTFLERKNLVPVFFDLTPADCVVSDIVERRGRIWEHEGGELWKLYDGQEREWKDVVEALVRVEDWRLEAFSGNWRDCIQRAVALVGSRLGRRSVADRERLRWERVDLEELPFARNSNFIGREKELKTLESLLFRSSSGDDGSVNNPSSDRGSVDIPTSGDFQHVRRKSNAEKAQLPFVESGGSDRRKSNVKEVDEFPHGRDEMIAASSWRAPNIVCITGVSGIGKTELALEYAYMHLQKYKMVLWVGGEARYIRQNYHNLSLFLGVDVSTESQLGPERGRLRTLEQQEADAVEKVKRELQRDVPYLLIIDNLEMEKDWWDGHHVSELLPRAGSASHVIITTRLARILDLEPPLVLSCLSGAEALTLMKGGKEQHFPVREYDKLKELEDRLARLTLGLSIIGKILVEFRMRPTELLEQINKVILKEEIIPVARDRDDDSDDEEEEQEDDEGNAADNDAILRGNPFLVRLLHVCFALLDGASEGEKKNLATRMTWVGGWFAPYAIPYSLLALAASKLREESSSSGGGGHRFRGKVGGGGGGSGGGRGHRFQGKGGGGGGGGVTKMFWCCVAPHSSRRMEAEAGEHLIKCNIARRSMQEGCIQFHAIVQTYARKQGGELAARAAVQAVRKGGNLMFHYDHFWAASFLVFRFGKKAPVVVDMRVTDLLLFTKKVVLPLALRAFTNFSRCNTALELLRQCNTVLEEMEKSFVSQIQDWWDKSLCWMRGGYEGQQVDEYVWQELTLLKAVLLETQAKLMMKGGQFDRGEEVCRTCLNIRSVMLGPDHVDTIAAQETLAKLVRYRNTM